jgi:hypothetical protein
MSARRRSICIVHDKAEYTLIVKGVFFSNFYSCETEGILRSTKFDI